MAGFCQSAGNRRYYGEITGVALVVAGAKFVGPLRSPLWLVTTMAIAVITAAAPRPIISVPLSISSAGLTPAGLPAVRAPSAAKAEEPIIVATVTAATTLLKPNISFPPLYDGGYL